MAALPNWVQGARRASLLITWQRENSTDYEDLTGATMTGFIGPASGIGAAVAITGPMNVTATVIRGVRPQFQWDFSAADVATAGNLKVQFVATFGSDPTPAKTFAATWYIERALAVI